MSADTRDIDTQVKDLADKLNKSGEEPMDEFKTGVGFLDKTVEKVDAGVKVIHNKVTGGDDK